VALFMLVRILCRMLSMFYSPPSHCVPADGKLSKLPETEEPIILAPMGVLLVLDIVVFYLDYQAWSK